MRHIERIFVQFFVPENVTQNNFCTAHLSLLWHIVVTMAHLLTSVVHLTFSALNVLSYAL